MGGEARLWQWLREQVGTAGHFSRLENLTDPGTPDLSVCVGRRLEAHLELKYSPRRRPLGDRGLRPAQRLWIARRLTAGGRVGFVVGFARDVLLLPGHLYRDLNELHPDELARVAYVATTRSAGLPPLEFRRFIRKL